jgi:hypothetical protein
VVTDWGTLTDHVTIAEALNAAATATAWTARIKDTGTAKKLSFLVYYNGSSNEVTWPSSGTIELNQRYNVEINWDINMRKWRILVNGNSVSSGNLTGSATSLAIGTHMVGSDTGNTSVNTIYYLDRFLVTAPLTPAAMTVNVESTVTLTYSDENSDSAVSCSIYNATNIYVSKPCSCNSGTCTVGVTGTLDYTGDARFDFRVFTNGQQSNIGTVELDIN